jgi:hypothetical protein
MLNEEQKVLSESTLYFNEAIRVQKGAPDLEKAIKAALKVANAKAKEKGLTPLKSESDLSKFKDRLKAMGGAAVNSSTNMSATFLSISKLKAEVIGGQLVLTEKGLTKLGSVRTVTAVYRSKEGKIKTIKVPFSKFLNMKGKMK